jgi:LDH2 family malate/lactate/ureidoglycolate dehydrogenase
MSLVFEMLASGLAANPIVPGFHGGTKEGRRHRQNGFILAIDVSAFLPLDEFKATVDDTVDAIKSLPPAEGAAQVLVPGERGRRCASDRRSSGVPLGAKPWRELTGLADALGVPAPTPLEG